MKKDEPEVIHLEWERVEDPTRDPVVVEEQPKPGLLDQPNPVGRPGNETAVFIVYALAVIVWALGVIWAGAL